MALDGAASRFALYQEVVGQLEGGKTAHEALRVFLMNDDYPPLVSTAALDFSVYHPLTNGDPLTGPKAVLAMLKQNSVECRSGLFKGLMLLGDDRVFELLREARRSLTPEEVRTVCGPGSGFLFASTIEFLIDWLEEAEDRGDEGIYGLVAAAIGTSARDAIVPLVTKGRRRFPVVPPDDVLEEGSKQIPFEEFAKMIEPRLRAIADREPPPQVMPLVLGAWGLEH